MANTQVSEHFTLAELTRTDTGLPNEPDMAHGAELVRLADTILEPMRAIVGTLKVNSGFRSLAVNTKIGGAHNSQHMQGQAADVVPLNTGLLAAFRAVKASPIPYDQLIWEPTWIHISIAPLGAKPRRQTLKAYRKGSKMVYEPA